MGFRGHPWVGFCQALGDGDDEAVFQTKVRSEQDEVRNAENQSVYRENINNILYKRGILSDKRPYGIEIVKNATSVKR